MPRRHSPIGTLVLLVVVLAFGGASYHFIVEKRVFANDTKPTPPASEIEKLRAIVDDALAREPFYQGITSFNWRQTEGRYRVDIQLQEGCAMPTAKQLARRVSDLVERATAGGHPAEVGVLMLGREVVHYVP